MFLFSNHGVTSRQVGYKFVSLRAIAIALLSLNAQDSNLHLSSQDVQNRFSSPTPNEVLSFCPQ